jgi:hypothetical protein
MSNATSLPPINMDDLGYTVRSGWFAAAQAIVTEVS